MKRRRSTDDHTDAAITRAMADVLELLRRYVSGRGGAASVVPAASSRYSPISDEAIRELTAAIVALEQRMPLEGRALLNATEAARYLGIARKTFYELHNVPAVVIPGMNARRYPVALLDKWIEEHLEH